MKTKLTLALAAFLTSSAFAAMPAKLPEFMNSNQLAKWRAETDAKNAAKAEAAPSASEAPAAFYTGKPYIESTGTYAFKYRSYSPELARWTSEDPSGFPDGANVYCYINNQTTNSYDYMGLSKSVVWLIALNGWASDAAQSGDIEARQIKFKTEMEALDTNGNPKPHYLDDGDIFTFCAVSNYNEIQGINDSHDQVYIACHGGYDSEGNFTGNWMVGGVSYAPSAFAQFTNVIKIHGCNPTDGIVNSFQLIEEFKPTTKSYLYE